MLILLRLLFSGGIVTQVAMLIMFITSIVGGGGFIVKEIEAKHLQSVVAEQKVKVQQLSTDNTILIQNNATLKSNVDEAAKANAATVDTNRKLLAERNQAQQALTDLAKRQSTDKKKADDEKAKIQQMLKDPKNDGAIAPVLRETLRDIQNRKKQK